MGELKKALQEIKKQIEVKLEAKKVQETKEKAEEKRKGIIVEPSKDTIEIKKAFDNLSDDVYILSVLTNKRPQETKLYKDLQGLYKELQKAMDTLTSGEGKEWIPTEFSARLIEKMHLALKVATLHEHIPMPTDPYKFPIQTSEAVAYMATETKEADASKFKESTPATGNIQLDSKKIAARVVFSAELEEDSIIPILPFVKNTIAYALAEAIEQATINGDASTTHQDADVTSSDDRRRLWYGYRKLALSASLVNCSYSGAGANLTATMMRNLRAQMGKWGVNPEQLAWVVGPKTYAVMMTFDDIRTIDKYGPQATVLRGELAKFDGIPVIVSEFAREDLNVGGKYDGSTTDRAALFLVYRPGFVYGDRRKVTLKTKEEIETDQTIVVSTARMDFERLYTATGDYVVGCLYNYKPIIS